MQVVFQAIAVLVGCLSNETETQLRDLDVRAYEDSLRRRLFHTSPDNLSHLSHSIEGGVSQPR